MKVKKKKIVVKAAKKKVKKAVPTVKADANREFVIKNYMEDIVRRNAAGQISERPDMCKCVKCNMDVVALALNHLPSKYVATQKGHIYTKLQEMETQFNADVTREVYKAVEFIHGHKRHE